VLHSALKRSIPKLHAPLKEHVRTCASSAGGTSMGPSEASRFHQRRAAPGLSRGTGMRTRRGRYYRCSGTHNDCVHVGRTTSSRRSRFILQYHSLPLLAQRIRGSFGTDARLHRKALTRIRSILRARVSSMSSKVQALIRR
jgi:hypothetical protein